MKTNPFLVLDTARVLVVGPEEHGGLRWSDVGLMMVLNDWKRGRLLSDRSFVREQKS